MPKYVKREFQVGPYWLDQRSDSPAWYRCWIEGRRTQRVSLGTADFEEAKRLLTDFFILENTPKLAEPEAVPLADVLRRYQNAHGEKVRSASHSKVAYNYWMHHWGGATVEELGDIGRQEAFHAFLTAKGLKASSVQRIISVGKAAVTRAYKRGELKQVPYILNVKVNKRDAEPMGRFLEVAEIRKLYAASQPHLKVFVAWMLGTAARPEAILDLTDVQVAWEDWLIDLNPPGRTQTKKYRPQVRLIPSLTMRWFEGRLIVAKSAPIRSFKKAWWAAREAAELPNADKVTSYSLRHTAARWMRRHGVSEWDTSTQLGHRRPGETETYTAFDPAYLKGAAAALDELVSSVLEGQELPVWGKGTVLRNGKPVNRVGWYASLPDGFATVEPLRANCAPVVEIGKIAAE